MPRAQGCAGAAPLRLARQFDEFQSECTTDHGMPRAQDAHDCRDAGGRAPKVGALGEAEAVAEERHI
jgi:hypothetical protein